MPLREDAAEFVDDEERQRFGGDVLRDDDERDLKKSATHRADNAAARNTEMDHSC